MPAHSDKPLHKKKKKVEVGTLWREEIPREVVARCDLNGLSGRDDSGAVYHERPVESSSSSSLSLSGQM